MNLAKKKCIPCEGGIPGFGKVKIKQYLKEISNWKIKNNHVFKEFKFKDFKQAIKFVNKIAKLAEKEGHHPNIFIEYNKVSIEIWTHAINGLSENDFILAAKIDKL